MDLIIETSWVKLCYFLVYLASNFFYFLDFLVYFFCHKLLEWSKAGKWILVSKFGTETPWKGLKRNLHIWRVPWGREWSFLIWIRTNFSSHNFTLPLIYYWLAGGLFEAVKSHFLSSVIENFCSISLQNKIYMNILNFQSQKKKNGILVTWGKEKGILGIGWRERKPLVVRKKRERERGHKNKYLILIIFARTLFYYLFQS